MPLSLSVFSQSGPPICTPIWAFFRAFKALRALKGPQIKFSHVLMHRPYRDLLNLKFSCLHLFPFSHKVVPQKASGGGRRGSGGGGSYTTLQLVNLKFWPWSWSKMANFDHLTTEILEFWPWSWSQFFDHLTMTPGRRSNGQKIVVILPPPEL